MGVATFATALYNLAPNNFFVLHFLNLLFQSSMILIYMERKNGHVN